MVGFIAGIIEGIATAWEWVKAVSRLGRVVTWLRKLRDIFDKWGIITCAIRWYFYLRQLEFLFKWLRGLGVNPSQAAEWLGITRLIGATNTGTEEKVLRALTHNREAVEGQLELAREIDLRRRLPPSPLNGSHTPPYPSTTILEVLYDYDNILGSGTMIIIFNPEGFGAKPRSPQIVRFVSEQEFNDFLAGSPSSKRGNSWGMFWRNNYLLRVGGKGGRKATTGRYKNYEIDQHGISDKDILESNKSFESQLSSIAPSTVEHLEQEEVSLTTGNTRKASKVEDLDDYLERTLELGEGDGDIITENMNDMINHALETHQSNLEVMTDAIENSKWGHALEEDGMRITSAVSDKVRAIPKNLQRIVSGNPVFRDVNKVTARYKRYVGRYRYLRDVWNAKKIAKEFDSITLALSGTMGQGMAATAALMESTGAVNNLLSSGVSEIVRQAETSGVAITEISSEYKGLMPEIESQKSAIRALNEEKASIENYWNGVDIEGAGYELENGGWYNPAEEAWAEDWGRITAIEESIGEESERLGGLVGELSKAQRGAILEIPKEFTKGLIAPPTCSMA